MEPGHNGMQSIKTEIGITILVLIPSTTAQSANKTKVASRNLLATFIYAARFQKKQAQINFLKIFQKHKTE